MKAPTGERILIVEDDAGVARLQQRQLERAGYDVLHAETAPEALRAIEQGGVDLMVLDHRLSGGLTGLDFFVQLQAGGHELPVIMVTGFSNETVVIRALRAGVCDFITKSSEYLDYLPEAAGRVLKQVRTERQLAESEAQLASIIRSAMDAILTVDAAQRITLFNAAAERVFHCPATEAIGQPLGRFIVDGNSVAAHGPTGNGKPPKENGDLYADRREMQGLRANGQRFPLEVSVSPGDVLGQPTGTVIARDISERRILEEQLRQAQKMEAVGRLAGGVAHDFNNLLTVINGYSDLLLRSVHPGDPLRGFIEEIKKAGERSASLTRQLLAFSRNQILAPVVLDLNALLTDMEKMLRRLVGEDIALATALAPDLWAIKADPGQVEQVVMNLVVNARDAMLKGGKIALDTANVTLGATDVEARPEVQPGDYVRLAVIDTGCGMDAQTQAHLFEPFFTTKEPGKGTGLGLATVYGIVKQSGGYIYVASAPGRGTTFQIYLPRVDANQQALPPSPKDRAAVPGTETVLLVEDEDGVRALARQILRMNGYTVLEACNGGEAFLISLQHRGPIHLLVTDVVMPRMSGRELAARLAPLQPAMKVLYLSGYTDDTVVHHGVFQAETRFLQKPFSPDALARKVREVLDKQPCP